MRQLYLLVILLFCTSNAFTNPVIKIEVSNDYKKYTNEELRHRIWDLERAVIQLQEQVFKLSHNQHSTPSEESWVCIVKGFGGDVFSEAGSSRAIATSRAIKACQSAGGGIFCKNPECSR